MENLNEFSNEMASIVVRYYKMNPEAHAVVSRWADWADLWSHGFRLPNAGEAFQEWLVSAGEAS